MHKNIVDPTDVLLLEAFPDGSKALFDFGIFEGMLVLFDEICSYKGNRKDNYESSKHDYVVDVFYRDIASHVRPLEEGIKDNLEIS